METTTQQLEAPALLGINKRDGEAPRLQRTAKKRRAKVVFFALLLTAASLGTLSYIKGRAWETTDNAQIEGHIANVAARVSGQVRRVLVLENQWVKAGDLLVELEASDLEVKVNQARAEAAQAVAALDVALAQREVAGQMLPAVVQQARGEIARVESSRVAQDAALSRSRFGLDAAQVHAQTTLAELRRSQTMFAEGAISVTALDLATEAERKARADVNRALAEVAAMQADVRGMSGTLESARGRLVAADTAPAQLKAANATVASAQASLERAQSQLRLAELNRSYADIHALASGVVARISAEPGQWVSPERPLLSLVADSDLWIVANYKEDQIGHMQAGQPARVEIDALPGREFHAHVESLSPASGSRFALLPPDNTSGNFVKVSQRVPVQLRLDDAAGIILRPGMSAYVKTNISETGSAP